MGKRNRRTAGLVGAVLAACAAIGMAAALRTEARAPRFVRGSAQAGDPAKVSVGERLFLETRFAQYYFAHSGGDPNVEPLPGGGDPVMATLSTPNGPIPGPFAGSTMNCRQCHLVDEGSQTAGGGFRTYADFAVRSPIPAREDGLLVTPRNSPPMLNLVLNEGAPDELYHFDGEFSSLAGLVKGSFTGRNFGWLPTEHETAVHHIALIVRGDDGKGELAQQFGGAYAEVLAGKSADPSLVLPPEYRIDVTTATDAEILDAVAKLVATYVDSLVFARNNRGVFTASPYDVFLQKNGLPRRPRPGEPALDYSRRLRQSIEHLAAPRYVTPADGSFQLSDQTFVFGPQELAGLKIFLGEPSTRQDATGSPQTGTGNCLACHAAPNFTDFKLHNTGIAQREYDALHGEGTFNRLAIPDLAERDADYNAYLPATPAHPLAQGPFRRPADPSQPGFTDLGTWNSYLNPDFEVEPRKLERAMGFTAVPERLRPAVLKQAIARFKTPGLRDLGDSAPYFHTGSALGLEEVVRFYKEFSDKARRGEVRNADPQLRRVVLGDADLEKLTAFLRSLKEDYN